ncbi:MAG: transposase [Bdellovibrio sp.]|nr:transposase [Bdellovibrio sp.]
MARKPLIYTHEHPYHIRARSNNREWFYISKPLCWHIFVESLKEAQEKYHFSIYAFVLMDNHYHLIGQCHEKHNLGEVMAYLQKTVSRKINSSAGRQNHIFGGPYKASLIRHPEHFAAIYKYVLRNPIKSRLTKDVRNYRFSTLNSSALNLILPNEWFANIPSDKTEMMIWLNEDFKEDSYELIKNNLSKTIFDPVDRISRKAVLQMT